MTHTSEFGRMPSGRPVRSLVLGDRTGIELHVLDLGATVHRLIVTCGDGVRRDVALGHPTVDDYLASDAYVGATVGRYANRIRGGRFELDGHWVDVDRNRDGNSLHGGHDGFDRRIWDVVEQSSSMLVLNLVSPAGDQGFPGELVVRATFAVTTDAVNLHMTATTRAPTVVNLTQHAYVNLNGEAAGTVDDHELWVAANLFTPIDPTGIPVGAPRRVDGTPFDLREPRRIGDVIREGHEQIALARGLDHNFVLNGQGRREVARLSSARTRTALTLSTDQPGLQVYTGNSLDGSLPSLHGGWYRQNAGIALEPQLFPDTPNRPDFGSAVLRPGERYDWNCSWRFDELP